MNRFRTAFAAVALLSFGLRAWCETVALAPKSGSDVQGGGLPEEVVVKAEDVGSKIGASKPPLKLNLDPYESIRASVEPDRNMFMGQSRFTVGWRHTHPELMMSSRVIEPWRSIFGGRSGIVFNVRRQIQDVLPNPLSSHELNKIQWSLVITDEEGRVFQQYESPKDPPEEIFWNGQNVDKQWIQPGHTYSAVYKFVDPSGSPYTKVGKPIQVSAIAEQETSGLVIGLDSGVLFGSDKSAGAPDKTGLSLLRDSADFIKRNFNDVSMVIRVFAASKELADSQGEAIHAFLARELLLAPQGITVQTNSAPYPERRVEIVLLNR